MNRIDSILNKKEESNPLVFSPVPPKQSVQSSTNFQTSTPKIATDTTPNRIDKILSGFSNMPIFQALDKARQGKYKEIIPTAFQALPGVSKPLFTPTPALDKNGKPKMALDPEEAMKLVYFAGSFAGPAPEAAGSNAAKEFAAQEARKAAQKATQNGASKEVFRLGSGSRAMTAKPQTFNGFGDLSLSTLEMLAGKTLVSKQYISDLSNRGDIKQQERDLIRNKLSEYPDGSQVPVQEFADKVKAELLPLKKKTYDNAATGAGTPQHENTVLTSELRGDVKNYAEHIYESPIKTSAGNVHFPNDTENYFGHTRTEDLPDNTTRRIIEVQTDLYQKGRLENEGHMPKSRQGYSDLIKKYEDALANPDTDFSLMSDPMLKISSREKAVDYLNWLKKEKAKMDTEALPRDKEMAKLRQYNDPTAHFRMIREEVKQAALDGKSKLQFPTGETAMKIEGLGNAEQFYDSNSNSLLSKDNIVPGTEITSGNVHNTIDGETNTWIVTEDLGDGKFRAIPKSVIDNGEETLVELGYQYPDDALNAIQKGDKEIQQFIDNHSAMVETFDISGKVDTNNPIYKFYEKEVSRYLKNKYSAQLVTDAQGVKWWEVNVDKGMENHPVIAFKRGNAHFNLPKEEALNMLRQYFSPKEMNIFFREYLGDGVLGQVEITKLQNKLKLLEKNGMVSRSTMFHEAFHGLLQLNFTEAERAEMYKRVLTDPISERQTRQYSKKDYKTQEERAEELLADKFAKWKEDQTLEKGFFKIIFEKILNAVRSLLGRLQKFDDIFKEVDTRRTPTPQEANVTRYQKDGGSGNKFPDGKEEPSGLSARENSREVSGSEQSSKPRGNTEGATPRGGLANASQYDSTEAGSSSKDTPEIDLGNISTPQQAKDVLYVEVDKMAQNRAFLDTIVDEPKGGKGIKGFTIELKKAYEDWVNTRSSAKISGHFKKKEFSDLDEKGIQGIFEFQSGNKEGRYGDVKKYFDDKYKKLQENGVEFEYKNDYLPQLWNNTNDEIAEAFPERMLGLKPSFTFESVIKDYQEGISKGLTPKFQKVSDLTGWYEQRAEKAIADRNFFTFLAKNSFIQPASAAPIGWKTVGPDGFPARKVVFEGKEYSGTYKAPPDLAETINNYLHTSDNDPLAKFANFAGMAKNIVLSSGIPKTGINAHGLNIIMRSTLASKNAIGGFLKGSYYLINPEAGARFLEKSAERAVYATKHGLTLSTEGHALEELETGLYKKWYNKVKGVHGKLFEEPLFNKIIPAIKIQHFNVINEDLLKHYPEEEAGKLAAQITNNIFGGINYDALGRNKQTRQILQSVILAPDWAETNIKIAGNTVKGAVKLTDPKLKAYRRIAVNLVAAFIAANILNQIINGKWMWENEPGHTFEIRIGKSADGKARYLRPFGTAADFVRIPYDVTAALVKGDLSSVGRVVRNRLSIPASTGASLLFNVDYLGRPILGKDKYGKPIPVKEQIGGLAGTLSNLAIPQYGQAAIDLATGRSNVEQAAASAVELPFRYGSAPKKSKKKNRINRLNF